MTNVYVSEPEAINLDELAVLLPADAYTIMLGAVEIAEDFTSDAEVMIIRSATQATAQYLQHFPRLQAIIRVGVGLDNVDAVYCKERGIAIFNAPGANADAVAEYVVAMILFARRRLYQLTPEAVRDWDRFRFMGTSISEQVVGIVGFGNIGKLLHKKLVALGCPRVLAYDPYLSEESIADTGAEPTDLDTILASADVISLHVPLMPETNHLINATKLQLLKDNAVLINASRGGIVDESAVLALPSRRNIFYIADTVEDEPHVNPALIDHERIIVTPHIASLTTASEKLMLKTAITNYLSDNLVKL